MSVEKLIPTPEAVSACLMVVKNGQPYFTPAGFFALSGSLAASTDIEEETRLHNGFAVLRVLEVARAGGLEKKYEQIIHRLFAEKVDPAGGSDKSKLLAELCKNVALRVGPGRMGDLIEGKKSH